VTDNNVIEYGNTARERAQRRKDRAAARQVARDQRSDREQLIVLYDRGINCGREYERLVARVKAEESSKKGKK
jgi:hypothetical protein